MRHPWIRTAGNAVIFGGWALPLLLARFVPARLSATTPDAVGLFRIVGGVWAFLAVAYALVLALRLRRSMM